MIEIPTSDGGPQEVAVAASTPDELPILPLKESVQLINPCSGCSLKWFDQSGLDA